MKKGATPKAARIPEGKVLLLWQNLPDSTDAYVFDTGSELAKLACQSAGLFINSDELPEDHPIFTLSERLEGEDKRPADSPICGQFVTVIVCGFVM